MSAWTTGVDAGTLLEGNANDDNMIMINDFGILAQAYGKLINQPGYDARTDFDRDGQIRITDFGLLALNYNKTAPVEIQKPAVQWTLKFAYSDPVSSSTHQNGYLPWVQEVEKITDGKVKIETYPGASLLSPNQTWSGLTSGIADIASVNTLIYPGQFDLAASAALPFTSTSGLAGSLTAWSLFDEFPEIQPLVPGVHVLTTWTTDPYFLISRTKNYQTLDDLAGQRIRTTGNNAIDLVNHMGAIPILVPAPEVYQAIDQEVINGALVNADMVLSLQAI